MPREQIKIPSNSLKRKGTARVFGLPRVGNHAVIDWILRNASDGTYVFANNCLPGFDPLSNYMSLEVNGAKYSSLVKHAAKARPIVQGLTNPFYLVSYERALRHEFNGAMTGFSVGINSFDFEVLITRGFPSWYASLTSLYIKEGPRRGKSKLETYIWILELAQRYKTMLSAIKKGSYGDVTIIKYDRWVRDEAWREAVLAKLGLTCVDNGLGEISQYGGGSSFNASTSKTIATERPRWQVMKDDPVFRSCIKLVLQDDEMIDLLNAVHPEDSDELVTVMAVFG